MIKVHLDGCCFIPTILYSCNLLAEKKSLNWYGLGPLSIAENRIIIKGNMASLWPLLSEKGKLHNFKALSWVQISFLKTRFRIY